MTAVRIVTAQLEDLNLYLDLLEDVADWLEKHGFKQWRPGDFRLSADYYSRSIRQQEVQLAFVGDELAGTLRLLLREPIVWPEVVEDNAVYLYNLAVKRTWAGQGLGRFMLDWADSRAAALERDYVRLDCFADNDFLRAYYLRAGFEERGEIEAHYPAPVGTQQLRRFQKRVGH